MRQCNPSLCILLLCSYLASGTGCHVFGIPSYRSDATACDPGFVSNDADCPTGVLPPMPGFLAAWHARKQIPQPPSYPRFQPLPTRPMFSPSQTSAVAVQPDSNLQYGHWPDAEQGGPVAPSQDGPMYDDSFSPDSGPIIQGSGTRESF